MNYNQRILKTGALAAAVTVAFAIFVYRAAEWSKGLNSEFFVLGQSGGAGPGTAAAPASVGATTKIIPQIAIGSFDRGLTKYITVIQIVNTGTSPAAVTGEFYKEDGSASTLTLETNLSRMATFTGNMNSTILDVNQVLVITGGATAATTPSTGAIGWGKITSSGVLSIACFFELRDGNTNVLYSRVGVSASRPDMSSFIIPRVRDVTSGLDVAFVLVNTASTPASITATLKDAKGATIGGAKTVTMAPQSHQALFTHQFFGLASEPSGRNYDYMTFRSTSASFAAIALAFEGGTQTSFPVELLQ